MMLFGWEISRKATTHTLDQLIARLDEATRSSSGVSITADNCMASPTIQAIVQTVSRRIASLPLRVYEETHQAGGKITRKEIPDHHFLRLFQDPSPTCDRVTFWLDAASWLIRHGNCYFRKLRGVTGPVRQLHPFPPHAVTIEQDIDRPTVLRYRVSYVNGVSELIDADEMIHARGPARDGVTGDSPVMDIREAIALEIAAERMGASVFGNSAAPGLIFKFAEGFAGFKTDEAREKFVSDFQQKYSRSRFASILLPKGIEVGTPINIEAEKAQFLQTRQLQRTVIAGAFGVPPHMVGDLTRGTYNNVEQSNIDFAQAVVVPFCRIFEAALERGLLTPEDRRKGLVIRFDVDALLRGDFKSRQEGLNLQRQGGVISANEWRAALGMNPISAEDGGDEYYRQGQSGQTAEPNGGNTDDEKDPDEKPTPGNQGAGEP
jgi:HK97 family phage portal protein